MKEEIEREKELQIQNTFKETTLVTNADKIIFLINPKIIAI